MFPKEAAFFSQERVERVRRVILVMIGTVDALSLVLLLKWFAKCETLVYHLYFFKTSDPWLLLHFFVASYVVTLSCADIVLVCHFAISLMQLGFVYPRLLKLLHLLICWCCWYEVSCQGDSRTVDELFIVGWVCD